MANETLSLSTNTLVDVAGLNKAYNRNKERLDQILDGTSAPEYAKKIGEDKVNHPQIGDTYNPVYVNSDGEIRPIMEDSSNTVSLGNGSIKDVYLGGERSDAITHSKSFVSETFSIKDKVTLRYDDALGALVFDFIGENVGE